MKSFTSRIGLTSKSSSSAPKESASKLPVISSSAKPVVVARVSPPIAAAPAAPVSANGGRVVEPQKWIVGKQYPVIPGELFYMSIRNEAKLRELQDWQRENGVNVDRVFVTAPEELQYFPFCADFGPMNFGMTYRFVDMLNEALGQARKLGKKIVYYCSADPAERTNAATLIAAYLVLDRGWTPEEAIAPLSFVGRQPFLPYRDASFQPVIFELAIIDILRGLRKAVDLKIIKMKSFDLEFYEHCDHPSMADLHEIIPGKFVAMKGPHTKSYYKDGVQFLAPSHYFELFKRLGVTAVVRLNDEQYPAKAFTDVGIHHHDIYFDDCTVPNVSVVNRWFEMCREEKGSIAVHCKAGLGRTGTLICLWMMRKWKFTGRECIGYIRTIRPGSILGPQQEYLLEMEQTMHAMGDPDTETGRLKDGAASRMSAEEEAREKAKEQQRAAAARTLAQENTDAMNRRAATMNQR